jgi:hypothetical protein
LIPDSWSRRRVAWVGLRRKLASRCWVLDNSAAVPSTSLAEGRCSSHQYGIKAASAVWIGHSVSSGFFPHQFLTHSGQEQVADRAERQVALEAQRAATLIMIQAYLALVIFETTLPTPTRKSHEQQGLDRGLRRGVAHEELDLVRVQHSASDEQRQG